MKIVIALAVLLQPVISTVYVTRAYLCQNPMIYLITDLEFRTQCESLAQSLSKRSMYYHGICYVIHIGTTTVDWTQASTMCTDFPNQRHKHLAFPNNDRLLDWIYSLGNGFINVCNI